MEPSGYELAVGSQTQWGPAFNHNPDELIGEYYRSPPADSYASYRDIYGGLNTIGNRENYALWAFLSAIANKYQMLQDHRMITEVENSKKQERDLDSIGGGHLLKRTPFLDSLGGGNLLKRGVALDSYRDRYWLKRALYLDPLGGGHLLKKKILDSIGGGHLIKKGNQLYDYFESRPTLDPIGGGHLLKRSEEQKTTVFTT